MPRHYSDPTRESETYSLPDVETFYMSEADILQVCADNGHQSEDNDEDDDTDYSGPGWYWWTCLPGCMPDSDPFGPFATEAEAIADAQGDA